MYCELCGAELKEGQSICHYCGGDSRIAPPSESRELQTDIADIMASEPSVFDAEEPVPKSSADQASAPPEDETAPPEDETALTGKKGMAPVMRTSLLISGITLILAVFIVGFSMLHVYGGRLSGKYDADSLVTPGDTVSSSDKTPSHSQRIVVTVKNNTADVTLLEYESATGKWNTLFTAKGFVGKNGATAEKFEDDKCTPKGTFDICFVYGLEKPDTKLEFRQVTKKTVWVDDPYSDYYNTWQSSDFKDKDWSSAVNLYTGFHNRLISYRIAFTFNGDCVTKNSAEPGRGSAIFIEGMASKGKLEPGYGSVSLSQADMTRLLGYLDSAKHPQVQIK